MLIKRGPDISASEITDEALYRNRWEFMRNAGRAVVGAGMLSLLPSKAISAFLQDKKNWKDRKSTRLNSSHSDRSRMPSSA